MVGRARDVFNALWEGKGMKSVPLTFPPCINLEISDMVYCVFSQQDIARGREQVKDLTNKWYSEVRTHDTNVEEEEEDDETELL